MNPADPLRSHLSDLAEEAIAVDLRDRSLKTSRRIGVRRTALTVSAAAAIVVAAAGTAIAFRPTIQNTVPPGDPTATGAATASPTTSAPTIDGTAYYARWTGDRYQVYSFADGRVTEHHAIDAPATESDTCVLNSVLVSPDGRYLSWVEEGSEADNFGRLTVARIDGTNAHQVDDIRCDIDELDWAADSSGLYVQVYPGNRTLIVDPASGRTRPSEQSPNAVDANVPSANGAFRAHRVGFDDRTLVIEDAGGTVVRRLEPGEAVTNEGCGYTVKGVSDDGRYVIVGSCATDPARIEFGRYLLDTVTERPVTLPGDDPVQRRVVGFVGAGNLVVRNPGALVLITPTGQELARVAEPAEVASAELIGYRQ